jgi:transcriptional regulator with XRE-family HTH domain
MKLAEMLRAWRYHNHMTLREAAERIGIPWSTYSRIEHGYPMQGETLAIIWKWMLSE